MIKAVSNTHCVCPSHAGLRCRSSLLQIKTLQFLSTSQESQLKTNFQIKLPCSLAKTVNYIITIATFYNLELRRCMVGVTTEKKGKGKGKRK